MANQSNSTEEKKAPRITQKQRKEIVEFFRNLEARDDLSSEQRYNITIKKYHKKWGDKYNITKSKLNSWLRADEDGGDKLRAKSLLPIYIFEILRKYSSPNNPMTEIQIKEKLNELDIFKPKDEKKEFIKTGNEGNRKIIPRHADGLVEALNGDLIQKKDTPKAAWYYNDNPSSSHGILTQIDENIDKSGNFLSLGEIAFLVDMINDSKAISNECTNALIHRLAKSLDEAERQNLVLPQSSNTTRNTNKKCDNKQYLELNEILENAIKRQKKVTICVGENEEEGITPIQIYHNRENDKYCFRSAEGNSYAFEDISFFEASDEEGDYPEDYESIRLPDSDDFKINKAVALDSLFLNTKEIRHAIANSQYLTFEYLSYVMKVKTKELDFEQSDSITVIPKETRYKNGLPYLLALDPKDEYKMRAYRIDYIQNIKCDGDIDPSGKSYISSSREDANDHPFMLFGFNKIDATFAIKADSIDRIIETFGKVEFIEEKQAKEFLGESAKNLVKAFPKLNCSRYLGFEHNEKLDFFTTHTTDEEALRFALQNGDVVELIGPPHLRERIGEIAEKMLTRHSRGASDREKNTYRKVISGEKFLEYSSLNNDFNKKIQLLIDENKTFEQVKKLHIGYSKERIPISELKKYTHVEELVIDGNGVEDFSWINKLSSLRQLTLIDSSITNANVLAEIPQLDLLFLNRNRSLENYEFLKSMKVSRLFIGKNGKADSSDLYDLKSVEELILEEKLLFDLDIGKLENIRNEIDGRLHHMRVRRWIDDIYSSSEMPKVYRLPLKR